MNIYYVYFLIDPRNGDVFYIGKGKENRINDHFKELDKFIKGSITKASFYNVNKLSLMKEIREDGYETETKKILENIKEESAFVLEEILVDRFGRSIENKGQLLNLIRGGNIDYYDIESKPKKTLMKEVRAKYPELIDVLKKYPNLNKTKYKKDKQLERELEFEAKILRDDSLLFKVGMEVNHNDFGLGIIKNIENRIGTINFPNFGTKQFYLKSATNFLQVIEKNKKINEPNFHKNIKKEKEDENLFHPTVTINISGVLKKMITELENELKVTKDKEKVFELRNKIKVLKNQFN
ncbi:MAG: hypothetical protein COA97_08305 [Flavobacteriales bacterium]|nr:MAG: hypothetical protein COA97_08305 [Flavobacteriales bacterium]